MGNVVEHPSNSCGGMNTNLKWLILRACHFEHYPAHRNIILSSYPAQRNYNLGWAHKTPEHTKCLKQSVILKFWTELLHSIRKSYFFHLYFYIHFKLRKLVSLKVTIQLQYVSSWVLFSIFKNIQVLPFWWWSKFPQPEILFLVN